MTLPEAAPKPDQSWIDDYPRETLEAMLEAGREVLEWRRIMQKSGDNVVGIVLKHEGQFFILDHYPKGDVYDPESTPSGITTPTTRANVRASTVISTPSCAARAWTTA